MYDTTLLTYENNLDFRNYLNSNQQAKKVNIDIVSIWPKSSQNDTFRDTFVTFLGFWPFLQTIITFIFQVDYHTPKTSNL